MGGGGRMNSADPARDGEAAAAERAPVEKPPFTLGDLRRAIPAHCFKRSLLRSSSYLAVDLLVVAALLFAAQHIDRVAGPAALRWALWAAYWAAQGCVATGVWVIAHECGHHAFSDHEWVDDAVGFVCHSLLLVPYFSWKYSHRRHHSNTANLERDEVFVPKPKERVRASKLQLQHAPGRALQILVTLTCGWPLYLLLNVSGRPYPRPASHFHPGAPIFSPREKKFVLLSDVGLLAVGAALLGLGGTFGFGWLARVYGVPLLIVNAFLVLITFLQHTHPALPHYAAEEWDWLRGALSTVDRDYGFLNRVMHHITDTHVAHHIFSTMPHYHAQEATRLIKPILGEYYQFDDTPVCQALWRETKECVFVEADADDSSKAGILWYKNTL